MLDLIIRNASIPDEPALLDIACREGRIVERAAHIDGQAVAEIDAKGYLVSPPFVDSHFHMDSTLTYGRPRVNESGTLLEGIRLWGELKSTLSSDDFEQRALMLCRWAVAKGNLAIRSHVDISDPSLTAAHVLLSVKEKVKPWLDLQLVAFPQDGLYRHPDAQKQLEQSLDLGIDVVGGIPHFERSYEEGRQSVEALCRIAADRGLMVDMHCDETDDPSSRHIETLASTSIQLGMHGRVSGSHLTSMHSMDDYFADKLLGLMHEAQINAIACPLINITLQGRKDTYPKRRGMTRVKEMVDKGINCSFGHDCVMDPWYAAGSHDMLEVAHMGLHVAQMTGTAQARSVYDAITVNPARALNLVNYGLSVGCNADMVILQAADPIEAIRLRATRLFVIRRGKIISKTPAVKSEVEMLGATQQITFAQTEIP